MPLNPETSDKTSGLISRFIAAGAIAAICSFAIIPSIINRGFGSRGTRDVYTFYYKKKLESVIREDIIWGRDRYFFSLENKKKGILETDYGTKINISGAGDKPYGFKWEDPVLPDNTN